MFNGKRGIKKKDWLMKFLNYKSESKHFPSPLEMFKQVVLLTFSHFLLKKNDEAITSNQFRGYEGSYVN